MTISRNKTTIDYIRELVKAGPAQKAYDQEIECIAQMIEKEKAQIKEEYMRRYQDLETENKRLKIMVNALADYIAQTLPGV